MFFFFFICFIIQNIPLVLKVIGFFILPAFFSRHILLYIFIQWLIYIVCTLWFFTWAASKPLISLSLYLLNIGLLLIIKIIWSISFILIVLRKNVIILICNLNILILLLLHLKISSIFTFLESNFLFKIQSSFTTCHNLKIFSR